MSEREPELDELLRSKFLSLGEAIDAPLDAESERRMVAQLQLEPTRRAKHTKGLRTWVASTGLLAAAAAMLFAWLHRDAYGPRASKRDLGRASEEGTAQACAWGAAEMTFVAAAEGRHELALGPAGHIVLAPGAEAIAKQDSACALTVELVRGSLAAELGNLRPGSLRVQTSLGDVQVRGTTFSVDLEDGLHVVLLSGAVELVDDGQVALTMAPGKSLRRRVRRAPPAMSDASAQEARVVSNLLSSSTSEPAGSADVAPPLEADTALRARERARNAAPGHASGLLGEAEAARRQGDTQRARALYLEAEQGDHADAEVALLRHAGFELETESPATAEKLLTEHRRRFPRSRLAAEAAWLGVRALQATGDRGATRAAARDLATRFPGTPQARAAQRLLEQP